jgi:hypothetical protein
MSDGIDQEAAHEAMASFRTTDCRSCAGKEHTDG